MFTGINIVYTATAAAAATADVVAVVVVGVRRRYLGRKTMQNRQDLHATLDLLKF